MTSKTNRRAIMSEILAATATAAALPASTAAQSPALSAIDRRVLGLWLRRRKLYAIQDRFEEEADAIRARSNGLGDRLVYCNQGSNACGDAISSIEKKIEDLVGSSLNALGASLIVAHLVENEHLRPLFRAALAAIRPHLASKIAEDAERIMAQDEEARA